MQEVFMFRVACALFAVVLVAGSLRAEEVRGKVKKVDADKGVITLTFPAAPGAAVVLDKDFTITKDTKLVDLGGKELPNGLKCKFFEKPGGMVTITVEK